MRRSVGLLAAMATLGLMSGAGSQRAGKGEEAFVELFENGGFEEGVRGWRTVVLSQASTYTLDSKTRHAGKQSLRIERPEGAPVGQRDFLKQSADLPGTEGVVRLRLAYKVASGARVSINAYFHGADGEFVGQGLLSVAESGATKKFVEFEEQWEVPARATGFGVNVIVETPGTVWVDAFEAGYSGPGLGAAGELANPGFEDGLDGWRELRSGRNAARVRLSKKVKAGGKQALEIERDDPRLRPPDGVAARVPAAALRKASLAFHWRTEDAARAAVVLQALDRDGIALGTERLELPSAAVFERGELELDLPPGTHVCMLQLEAGGRGKVWFDELVLAPGKPGGK